MEFEYEVNNVFLGYCIFFLFNVFLFFFLFKFNFFKINLNEYRDLVLIEDLNCVYFFNLVDYR